MGEGGIDNECIGSSASAKYSKKSGPSPGPSPPGPSPPGPSPPGPSKSCSDALTKTCGSVKSSKFQCLTCVGQHASALIQAGCSGMDEFKFCGIGQPADLGELLHQ